MSTDTSGGASGGAATTTAPKPPGGFDDHESRSTIDRLQHVLHANPILGPLTVLVIAIVVFSILNPRFLGASNLSLVLQQVTVTATLALGQTIIILTAGIDLSVGLIAVFSSIIMANLSFRLGMPGIVALLIGIVLGTAMGALNGLLVTRVKLPPFIATLGTFSIFTSLNNVVSRSETIRGSDMSPLLTATGNIAFRLGTFNVTWGTLLMLVLFVIFFYVLNNTAWGKHVYATGDDIEAARLAGIRTDRVLLSVYLVAGVIYSIGAWVLMGRNVSAGPNADDIYNLATITAVVIGGTSLFGGRGLVLGTLVGTLIVGVFQSGLKLAGVEVVWQGTAIGLLVLAAVALDQWIRRVKS